MCTYIYIFIFIMITYIKLTRFINVCVDNFKKKLKKFQILIIFSHDHNFYSSFSGNESFFI